MTTIIMDIEKLAVSGAFFSSCFTGVRNGSSCGTIKSPPLSYKTVFLELILNKFC